MIQEKCNLPERPAPGVTAALGWKVWLLLPLFGLVFGALLLETSLRVLNLVNPQTAHNKPRSDRPRRYFFPESARSVRDGYYPEEKPSNTFRIAVLGDSFTFGTALQLDDTFPKRLERILNLNLDAPRVEVLNYGVPGSSTADEVDHLKRLLKYRLDLLLLEVTLNDPEPPNGVTTAIHREVARQDQRLAEVGRWSKAAALAMSIYYRRWRTRAYTNFYWQLYRTPAIWKGFENALREFAAVAAKAHVRAAAVVFPLFSYNLQGRYEFATAHEQIGDALRRAGLPFVDLLRPFKGMSKIAPDNAHAIVRAVDALVSAGTRSAPPLEIVEVCAGEALIVVGPSKALKQIPWLRLVSIAPGRFLLSIPSGTPIEMLELALVDLLEHIPADQSYERELVSALRSQMTSVRRERRISKAEILLVAVA